MTKLRAIFRAILPPRDTLIIDVLNRVIGERDEARQQLSETRADLAIVLDAIDRAATNRVVS